MASKLTLNINEELLEEIKQLAAQRNKSLNELVAEYFRVLIELKKKNRNFTPVLSEIAGILKTDKSSKELIDEYKSHLLKKYL